MAKVPKIGGRKIVTFQAFALAGKPQLAGVPRDPENPEAGVDLVAVPSMTDVGIVAQDDQGDLWFRSKGTPWVQVPGLEEDLDVPEELSRDLSGLVTGRG